MFRIGKTFAFEAAHHLPQMPDDHQCKRPHGHSYVVEVELVANHLDADGFVEDFGRMNWIKGFIDSRFDHRDLTEVLGGGENTTAERLAVILYWVIEAQHPNTLHAVTVRETAKTFARYEWDQSLQDSEINRLRAIVEGLL